MTFQKLVAERAKLNKVTGRKFVFIRIGDRVLVEARDPGKVYCGFLGIFENASKWIDGVITGFEIGYAKAEKDSEEELLFMAHSGVQIFSTYIHGNEQDPMSDYWYSTVNDGDPDSDFAFDWRDLLEVPKEQEQKYRQLFRADDVLRDEKMRIAYAIDEGNLDQFIEP